MKLQDVTALLVLVACICITTPLVVYCAHQLIKNWNEQYLIKRKRPVIVCLFCMLTYQSLIEVPSYAMTQLISDRDIKALPIATLPIVILNIPIRIAFVLLINVRVWLLYFDFQFHSVVSSKPWQMLISPAAIDKNW